MLMVAQPPRISGLGLMDLLGAILLVVAAVGLTVYLILVES